MLLKQVGGRHFTVNLLADFILSKIPENNHTIIKVADCENFFVVKGKTTSKEILNLSELVSEFISKFDNILKNKKITHTIDLIEYDSKIEEVTKIKQTFHQSTNNCSYSKSDVESIEKENDLIYISSFPHGYSLSQGRLLYYYGKKIFYSIPSNYPVDSLTFTLSTEKTSDGEPLFSIYDEFHKEEDNVLKSAILDVFNFDMSKVEKEIKKVEWFVELTNPLEDYEFLKENEKGLIII